MYQFTECVTNAGVLLQLGTVLGSRPQEPSLFEANHSCVDARYCETLRCCSLISCKESAFVINFMVIVIF